MAYKEITDKKLTTSAADKTRETRTLADYYDMQLNALSSFDLPINDYRDSVADLMINQVGTEVKIDGTTEHIMLSDLQRVYTNIQGNMKDGVFLHSSNVQRGSRIDFENGAIGICWSIPDDDLVSLSAQIIIMNNEIEIFRIQSGYDENPDSPTYGDALDSCLFDMKTIPVFAERIDGEIRAHDVGILYDSIIRIYTFYDEAMGTPSIEMEDVVRLNGKYYEISDIDNFISGICKIQLRNTRTVYDDWKIKPFESEI